MLGGRTPKNVGISDTHQPTRTAMTLLEKEEEEAAVLKEELLQQDIT